MSTGYNPYTREEDPYATDKGRSVMEQGPSSTVCAPSVRPRPPAIPENQTVEVSEDTIKKIRNGFVAALISGTLTLIFTVLATAGSDVTGFLDAWAFIDVVFIFALAVGIYFKSRVAATTMFVYFLAAKIYTWVYTGQLTGIFLAAVFIYFYYQAMVGTYEYHKQTKGG